MPARAHAVDMNTPQEDLQDSKKESPVRISRSRSPHPYHRTRNGPRLRLVPTGVGRDSERRPSAHGHTDSDSDRSSDSGTEADTEGQILKSLPAPPLLRRKGLRGASELDRDDTPSPPFTPFPLELSKTAFELPAEDAHVEKQPIESETERRKRHGEFLRRGVEIALMIATSGLILSQNEAFQSAKNWRRELASAILVLAPLAALYPVRLYLDYLKSIKQYKLPRNWKWFRIRSTFDPAPLIYPALMPLMVCFSLGIDQTYMILPNITLSIATLPPELVPFSEKTHVYSTFHWLLSTVPLLVSNRFAQMRGSSFYSISHSSDLQMSVENFVLLFPLHHSLMSMLRYLTKTSLLPAEIQLLSVALINILFHSRSPQAVILKCLIWGLGSGIAVFCSVPLLWGVKLARIPRWRFRRPNKVSRPRNGVLRILSGAMHWGKKEGKVLLGHDSETSSNDEEQPLLLNRRAKTLRHGKSFDVHSTEEAPRKKSSSLQRRHTVTVPMSTWEVSKKIAQGRFNRWMTPDMKAYLTLTAEQASTRKWAYAAYVYIVTLLLILGPVRTYIRWKALHGNEPIGWAVGYLLGTVPAVRLWTVKNGLERWICLPPHRVLGGTNIANSVEDLRQAFGVAQVRLSICAYFLALLGLGIGVVQNIGSIVEVDTKRKVFHGMMVAMLLPATYVDPSFISLALCLILAIFLLLDLFRASQLPPISGPLARFLQPYVDGRDLRGPVVVSHIFLLIGCAIPLWLSMAAAKLWGNVCEEDWNVTRRELAMVSGVVCVGLGDAAASLIGRRYGRTKWPWGGGKSLNGSFAFAVAVAGGLTVGKAWLYIGWHQEESFSLVTTVIKAFVAGAGGSLIEATLTGCNDNVVVPILLWLVVRGLGL